VDGRLRTGDEILSVDGMSVVHTSHHHVVQLMGAAALNGRVTIGVRRWIPVHPPSVSPQGTRLLDFNREKVVKLIRLVSTIDINRIIVLKIHLKFNLLLDIFLKNQ